MQLAALEARTGSFAAVPLARLYHDTRLALPIGLMGLVYLATPLCWVQGAFMQREHRLGRVVYQENCAEEGGGSRRYLIRSIA